MSSWIPDVVNICLAMFLVFINGYFAAVALSNDIMLSG